MQSRVRFTLLWIASGLWLPLILAIWSGSIRRGPEITAQDYVIGALSTFSLAIIALTQWPLLRCRVPLAWLWAVAGIAAVLVEQFAYFLLFNLAVATGGEPGEEIYYVARVVAAGLAISTTQAAVLALWRAAWKSWLPICFFSFLGAFAISTMVILILAIVLPQTLAEGSMASNTIMAICFWSQFGGISGWLLWRRLAGAGGSVAMPA